MRVMALRIPTRIIRSRMVNWPALSILPTNSLLMSSMPPNLITFLPHVPNSWLALVENWVEAVRVSRSCRRQEHAVAWCEKERLREDVARATRWWYSVSFTVRTRVGYSLARHRAIPQSGCRSCTLVILALHFSFTAMIGERATVAATGVGAGAGAPRVSTLLSSRATTLKVVAFALFTVVALARTDTPPTVGECINIAAYKYYQLIVELLKKKKK